MLPLIPALLLAVPVDEPLLVTPSRSFHTGDAVTSEAYFPQGQAVADLDGDGDMDVVLAHVGNYIAPRFCILWNEGGALSLPTTRKVSDETMDVVAVDLDGDLDVDLAFAQSDQGVSGSSVLVFLNQGDGTFGPETKFTTGKGPTGIAAFDADLDGDLDLATANNYWGEEDVSVLFNDGTGKFPTRFDLPLTGEQPYKVVAGDVDGDGNDDLLATVNGGKPDVTVFLSRGNGSFLPPQSYDAGYPYMVGVPGVATGDVDLDGDLDVLFAVGQAATSGIALFRNMGGGVLAPVEILDPGGIGFGAAHELAVADVTGDGWPDVLGVGHSSKYGFTLVPGDGTGGFLKGTLYRSGEMARALDVVDMGVDGRPDVVVANTGSLTVTVHESKGGALALPAVNETETFGAEIAAGDLDSDGRADVVHAGASLYTLLSQGDGTFQTTKEQPFSGFSQPALADLNGDTLLDLAVLNGDDVVTARNSGTGSWISFESTPLGTWGCEDLAVVDFDGDGDLDAVAPDKAGIGAAILLLQNDGTGTLSPWTTVSDSTSFDAERAVTGDFDLDGRGRRRDRERPDDRLLEGHRRDLRPPAPRSSRSETTAGRSTSPPATSTGTACSTSPARAGAPPSRARTSPSSTGARRAASGRRRPTTRCTRCSTAAPPGSPRAT